MYIITQTSYEVKVFCVSSSIKIIHRASQRHKIDRISILLTRYIFSGQTEGMWTQVVMMSIGDDMAPTSHGIVEFYLSWGLCLCGGNHREGRNEY